MTRCDTCRFWVEGEQYGGSNAADYRLGTCHRHAPRPTKGDFEYRVLQALMMTVPVKGNSDDQLTDLFEHWEEAVEGCKPTWPSTLAEDWCGEYGERK